VNCRPVRFRQGFGVAATLLLAEAAHGGCGKPTPSPAAEPARYVTEGGQVYDRETNLTWDRCSIGQTWATAGCSGTVLLLTWDQAAKHATGGWRLPSQSELESLVVAACRNPAIDENLFPNLGAGKYWYWSSSALTATSAWVVYFGSGTASPIGHAFTNAVRLVQSGRVAAP
jgi:hypothetical protein